ncbi:MAG: hypothetical protein FJ313_05505, partial [Gemmatimonadetes bacterium]|nr:hypothetical protein [Gemmatimonadota bacterium]
MWPTHRERVLSALDHEETDRVPYNFGGAHPDAYAALLDYLGFAAGPPGAPIPSERVLRRFDDDVRRVSLREPHGGSSAGPGVDTYVDEWGVTHRRAHHRAPFMCVRGPLQHLAGPSPRDLDSIPWPDPADPVRTAGLGEQIARLRQETDCAIVLRLSNGPFAVAQRLRGFTELLEDLLVNPGFAQALLERLTDVLCAIAASALAEMGDQVDCVRFADDMGMQTQPYMSRGLYRRAVKPHHARYVHALRRKTGARVILHSDGAVSDLIPDFIDIGIDVLDPVQVGAAGMRPERLKREFGSDICFWGAIDVQAVLPFGSPADVAR